MFQASIVSLYALGVSVAIVTIVGHRKVRAPAYAASAANPTRRRTGCAPSSPWRQRTTAWAMMTGTIAMTTLRLRDRTRSARATHPYCRLRSSHRTVTTPSRAVDSVYEAEKAGDA